MVLFDLVIYNSRDSRCKAPYGAVSSGTKVALTLRPARSDGWSRAELRARFEFREDEIVTLPLPWAGLEEDRDLFAGALDTGDYVGLVWYAFHLEALDGRTLDLGEYQLTVYDDSHAVPDWFGAGMSYQIFPDRFCRTRVPDPAGMVGGRVVHQSWCEGPVFGPDAHGEVRNRDFFGGSFAGVLEKLDYIQSLGTDTIYFCPVFEGAENHRYGTGDYEKIDPMLGTNEEFSALCAAAHQRGMRVMLDGVFNHVGFVSRYFNGDGAYPVLGARQSQDSPYAPWFSFTRWPDKYDAWWGIYSLPAVNESCADYVNYMIEDEDSIVRRWLRAGADGWRLDVADELPDGFIQKLRAAARAEKPDSFVLGEVWEDGTTKIAYGVRRKHLLGGHLDGLMNYPFRTALVSWLLGGDARQFMDEMERLRENYPPSAYYSAMNSLGTHDTPRIFTLLGVGSDCASATKDWRAGYRMTEEERTLGKQRLKLAALVLFCFPGSPTVYYGDEVGMEGFEDPFNRQTYPWGFEDAQLLAWFTGLGKARREHQALRRGDLRYVTAHGPALAFTRTYRGETVLCACNAGPEAREITVPWSEETLTLPPLTGRMLVYGG